jgi:hypothetical protein
MVTGLWVGMRSLDDHVAGRPACLACGEKARRGFVDRASKIIIVTISAEANTQIEKKVHP